MVVRKSLVLLFLALSLSAAYAYQLAITVTVTQGTLSIGSNVSLVTNGVEIAAGRTGADGIVRFNASNGSYFAVLKSSIYPTQVSLIEVSGDTEVTLTKRQMISYASAYGQIMGPENFSGASVSAFQNGLVAKRVEPNAHGYYVLSFIPDGTYDMVFEVPEYGKNTERAYLGLGEFTEVNSKMAKPAPEPEPLPVLTAPQQVQQSTTIEVQLSKGGVPLSGETVIAETPSGKVELTTDLQGKAALNAAQSGLYRFTFGELSASTMVPPKEAEKPAAPQPAQPAAPSPSQPAAPAQPEQLKGSELLAAAALFFILLLAGLLALVVWVKAVAPALAKKAEAPGQDRRQAESHKHNQAHSTKSAEHRKAAHHRKK